MENLSTSNPPVTTIPAADPALRKSSPSTKSKRSGPKFYSVRLGHKPGIYHTWEECLRQVKGFKKATFKSFSTLTDAERFLAGENPPNGTAASPSGGKFYAVKSGRVPGVYTDWESASVQITGWTKPKHKCFASKAEALRWMSEDEDASNNSIRSPGNLPQLSPTIFEQAQRDKQHGISQLSSTIFEPSTADFGPYLSEVYSGGNYIQPSPTANKKRKISQPNGMHKTLKSNAAATASITDFDEADFEPGTAPLPPGTEDGYDPNLMLDPATGHIVYKTQEQRQATRIRPVGPSKTEPLRIYTDGSSLGNGTGGANAGVGIWFGPGDVRNLAEPLPPTSRQTNQRAELTALLRALELSPRNRPLHIFSDSKYAIDCVTSWYINWRKNNWRTATGGKVENRDLVESVVGKIEERDGLGVETRFEWVKGHKGNEGNVQADRLAVEGAREGQLSRAGRDGGDGGGAWWGRVKG